MTLNLIWEKSLKFATQLGSLIFILSFRHNYPCIATDNFKQHWTSTREIRSCRTHGINETHRKNASNWPNSSLRQRRSVESWMSQSNDSVPWEWVMELGRGKAHCSGDFSTRSTHPRNRVLPHAPREFSLFQAYHHTTTSHLIALSVKLRFFKYYSRFGNPSLLSMTRSQ